MSRESAVSRKSVILAFTSWSRFWIFGGRGSVMCTLTWGEVWLGVCRFVIPGVTQSIAIIMIFRIGSSLILVARSTKDIGKDA